MKSLFKILALTTALVVTPPTIKAGEYKIPYLFEHPRDGKFKTIPWSHEPWDGTTKYHYRGSAMLSSGLNFYFDQKNSKNPELKAGLITIGIGLLKEAEDGFREGFSSRDLAADAAGTISGILLYKGGKWLIDKL